MVLEEVELSLAVEHETDRIEQELLAQWQTRLEQVEYEARRAERRYKAVEPENRVVARTLERQWEERLQELEAVQRQYEEAKARHRVLLSGEERAQIRALAQDLPRVWHAATTAAADRKAMLRIVIEAVTAEPLENPRRIRVRVQWKSGVVTELVVERPRKRSANATPDRSVERIRELAAAALDDEAIAKQLNEEGVPRKSGQPWIRTGVQWIRQHHGIEMTGGKVRRIICPKQLPDGSYSIVGAARTLGVGIRKMRSWVKQGLVRGQRKEYSKGYRAMYVDLDEQTKKRLLALHRG